MGEGEKSVEKQREKQRPEGGGGKRKETLRLPNKPKITTGYRNVKKLYVSRITTQIQCITQT
jgi:hypothetical protein